MPTPDFWRPATAVWEEALRKIMKEGEEVSPRGKLTREILSNELVLDMRFPIVTTPERKLGYKFMAAEAAWILMGDNRLSTIGPFSSAIAAFSDDGVYFKGAYGPKVVDQLSYVVDTLRNDPDSRQAVLNIWRENPRNSFDTPCTLNLQWLIRDKKLHVVVNMRSSDMWLGVPYDIFNFTMLSGLVALLLERRGVELDLGRMYFHAGSQHVYENNFEKAQEIIDRGQPTLRYEHTFDHRTFADHVDFVEYLYRAPRLGVPDRFLSRIPGLERKA